MFITPIYGEILIIFLIILTSSRIFFIDNTRIDSFVLFAPLTFIISILQILNWGFNLTEQILFYASFLVFFINWRSLLRFFNHLYIDNYSITFKISSSLIIISSLMFAILLIINSPIHLNEKKYQITTETKIFTKINDNNFLAHDNSIKSKDMILKIYSPDCEQGKLENDFIVLFIPDKRATIQAYDSYLTLLAKSGFRVYAANFGFSLSPELENTKIRLPNCWYQYNLRKTLKKNDAKARELTNLYKSVYAKEYEILSKIADQNEAHLKKFVIVADGIPQQSLSSIQNPARKIEGCFSLNSIDEYKTNGYGFIEQSDPITAKFVYGLKKDISNHVPSYAAMKTKNAFEAIK